MLQLRLGGQATPSISIDLLSRGTPVRKSSLVYEQTIVVHVVLLDKLRKLVGLLGVVQRVNIQHLVAWPSKWLAAIYGHV
jgi:hypothetical protein